MWLSDEILNAYQKVYSCILFYKYANIMQNIKEHIYRDVSVFGKTDDCKNYDFGSIFATYINTSAIWKVLNICHDL